MTGSFHFPHNVKEPPQVNSTNNERSCCRGFLQVDALRFKVTASSLGVLQDEYIKNQFRDLFTSK